MKKIVFVLLNLLTASLSGQESDSPLDSTKSFTLNADFVNRYIWRGLLFSPNPNIQPYAAFTNKNFTIGAWGSYGTSENYAEVDLYMSYKANKFTFSLNDYYAPYDETDPSLYKYFEFASEKTLHAVEGSVLYSITDNFNATVATFFYGNDRDSVGDNYYSTYMELGYSFAFSNIDFALFAGGTFGEGYYATEASVVNAGITFTKNIAIIDKFSIPVSGSLVFNPNKESAFFIFKITL